MKHFTIAQFFGLESRSNPQEQATAALALKSFPQLKTLNLPDEQIVARAKAIAQLDTYINSETKFSHGNSEAGVGSWLKDMVTPSSRIHSVQEQMKDIKNLLLTKPDPKIWDDSINTYLNRINPDGSANMELDDTKMSKRVFLQRIVGPSLAGKIIVTIPKNIEQNKQLKEGEVAQKLRLEQVLLTLEIHKSGDLTDKVPGNKGPVTLESAIRHTRSLLQNNQTEAAKNYLGKALQGKYNGVDISTLGNDAGLAAIQRALGDTSGAGQTYLKIAKENSQTESNETDESSPQAQLNDAIREALLNQPNLAENIADEPYNTLVSQLPHNDPERIFYKEHPRETKDLIKASIILKNTVYNFIKENGSKGLSTEMQNLDDMKGLHGLTNLSDENAAMVREILIMTAATIVTMGLGTVASGVATATRVAQGASRFGKAAQLFHSGKYIRGTVAGINAASKGTIHNVAKGVATGSKLMNKNAILRTTGNALVFTGTDEVMRGLWSREGEKNTSFEDFAKKLANNAAMFAAFGGMEKITGPLASKIAKVKPGQTALTLGQNTKKMIVLTAGDVLAMQTLHAAETGKFEAGWEAVAMALVYRVGVTAASKYFPNSIKALGEKDAATLEGAARNAREKPTGVKYRQTIKEISNFPKQQKAPTSEVKVPRRSKDMRPEAYDAMVQENSKLSEGNRIKAVSREPGKKPTLIIENKGTQRSFKNLPDENAKYQMKNQQKVQDASKLGDPNINKLQPKQNSKGKSFENLPDENAKYQMKNQQKVQDASKLGDAKYGEHLSRDQVTLPNKIHPNRIHPSYITENITKTELLKKIHDQLNKLKDGGKTTFTFGNEEFLIIKDLKRGHIIAYRQSRTNDPFQKLSTTSLKTKVQKPKSEVATSDSVATEVPVETPKNGIPKKTVLATGAAVGGILYAAPQMTNAKPAGTVINQSAPILETPPQIEETREINGRIANSDYRNRFNELWLTYPMWKSTVTQWNNYYNKLTSKTDTDNSINTAIQDIRPDYKTVQNLQRLLNMGAEDSATGQDGMLGKNTISALRKYMQGEVTSTGNNANTGVTYEEVPKNDPTAKMLNGNNETNNAASARTSQDKTSGIEPLTPTNLSA